MNVEEVVEVVVQRFAPKPGETVVISFPGAVTPDQAEALKAGWSESFPDNPCVVFTHGGAVTGVLEEA